MTASTINPGRLRWHSRRALLELDLVLQRYWQRQGEQPPAPEELVILSEMLALEDHDLWDMMCGRREVQDPRWLGMIATLMKV